MDRIVVLEVTSRTGKASLVTFPSQKALLSWDPLWGSLSTGSLVSGIVAFDRLGGESEPRQSLALVPLA